MTFAERIADESPVSFGTEAPVMTYADLRRVIRERIAELDVTYETIDTIAGFPARYTSKLLCEPPLKIASGFSMFSLLRAVALLPKLEHDGEQLAALQKRSQWQCVKRNGPQYRPRLQTTDL